MNRIITVCLQEVNLSLLLMLKENVSALMVLCLCHIWYFFLPFTSLNSHIMPVLCWMLAQAFGPHIQVTDIYVIP